MSPSSTHAGANGSLETDILVVGGGPVGMFAAYRLAQLGQSCILIEQNEHTTPHPKAEYTSHRTMEIYRRIGLADYVRSRAVPEVHDLIEIFSTGFGDENFRVASIDRPSPEELRKTWAQSNDGSHPLEPYMRQSQVIFEKIMKTLVLKEPLISSYWGYTFQSLTESNDHVLSTILNSSGKPLTIKSRYVIGTDGAGSNVRRSAGLISPRNALPLNISYVHFKSTDIKKLQSQGEFWHMVILSGVVFISQDEIDTFTIHQITPPGSDRHIQDPKKFVQDNLGGMAGPYNIKIDEVLVSGTWQADMSIANSFRSDKGRVFLAGDSAHQLTPAGGHGMNSGIQDAYDLSWKLAAFLRGWGGDGLLDSYNKERRPVAEVNTAIVVKGTMEVMIPWLTKAQRIAPEKLLARTEDGQRLRDEMKDDILLGEWIHDQTGPAMGYRYNDSPIVIADTSVSEPPTSVSEYIPSTWPGARAPHVFLADGKTSIFDLYGPSFTIVDFTAAGAPSQGFVSVASKLNIPITRLHLPGETHCRLVWERDVVLIRPDGFVAWRCLADSAPLVDASEIERILLVAVGKTARSKGN